MARIRTIKPEFPQSESMGRVSRDARLLFVELWTICDDHGRTRAHSRMLASLLFPYDDDAGELLPAWLDELEKERCIRLYEVNGSRYLQVVGWKTHQKIDKPSKPQFPDPPDDPREASRDTREHSSEEGKGREGKGREGIKDQGREEESEPIGSGASLELEPPDPAAGKPDLIPYQAIVDAFNATMVDLPKVRELTPKRRTLIRTAWQASPQRRSIEFWRDGMFPEYQDDPFTNGTGPYRNGHENWRPSFDYLMRNEVITRVFERAMDRLERGDA